MTARAISKPTPERGSKATAKTPAQGSGEASAKPTAKSADKPMRTSPPAKSKGNGKDDPGAKPKPKPKRNAKADPGAKPKRTAKVEPEDRPSDRSAVEPALESDVTSSAKPPVGSPVKPTAKPVGPVEREGPPVAADAAAAATTVVGTGAGGADGLNLPGVGPKVLDQACRIFGSEAEFLRAARDGEVDRIAAVPGIGDARAVEVVHAVLGTHAASLFGTPRVEELFTRVRDNIVELACTRGGRNRLRLIAPLSDAKARAERVRWALEAADEIAELPMEVVREHLAVLKPLPGLEPSYEAGIVVFVDGKKDRETLLEAGIDRWAAVVSARDVDAARGAEAGVYAYSDGTAAVAKADHVVEVPFTADPAVLVPWAVTERFAKIKPALEASAALSIMRGREAPSEKALAVLASLPARPKGLDPGTVEATAQEMLEVAMAEAEDHLDKITLTGADLMRAMNAQAPAAIRDVYAEALKRARVLLSERIGMDLEVYTDTLPPQVDVAAIRSAVEEAQREGARLRLEAFQRAAQELGALVADVEAELADHAAFDARQAMGSYVREHSLTAPRWGAGLRVRGALHLDHSPSGDRVDYRIGATEDGSADDARLALVTGANSGGKTTLLETITQVVTMAHAGLPVPADDAIVPEVDMVHFFAQRRSMGAGAFESFLRRFFPIAHAEGRSLVLADELEAMTELEAAAEIIAAFLEQLAQRDALAVVVTHMAPHVVPSVRAAVRVDGIEATGLDSEGRLIVERSPKLGHHARSTPELILRRLAERGPKDLRATFAALSDRVGERMRDAPRATDD